MQAKEETVMLYCERLFFEGGPFFHLYTEPLKDDLLFRNEEELNEGLNMLAIAVTETRCDLLAFALMHNHLHLIIEGRQADALECYSKFQSRLAVYLRKERRQNLAYASKVKITPIESLKQLRDEVAYVIRNPFAARTNVNLFAYKWCSGYLYFNDLLSWLPCGKPACEMSIDQRRAFKHSRDAVIDNKIRVFDGVALPSSFVDYKRTMSFFENARQFLQCVMKNVESQVEIAKRLGEEVVLDDTELWGVARRICREQFKFERPRDLPAEEQVKLIRTIKFDYGASNQQIARCLGVQLAMVNQMFPLSVRK